ncbi:heptaprenyl diphosphate synthase subunit I [Neobacillus bataviensis LMG 21833]|uniref:Heptaprenyl diphosphate synthase subunit I n=1 Tax=Neobacillus bataviensis LMG 21833 TaxID=1117379 RepID=K6DAR2_9BACI|nr:heptaprenyl diphosphate synthase subunit I [Neobacillus bataviensis LMG 21833]
MQDIRQKYTIIREQIEKRAFDSYLLTYIETPIIDEDKLLILISIMDRLELSFNEIKNYALSTMLIQIALDTHEHISNSTKDEKGRQLTVLAGDYFSGLYYKLLAESEDIMMIKSLSKGVKEVNENKVFIYHNKPEGIEKLMASIMRIESALLTKLSEYFKVDFWNDFLAHLFLFKRLLHEKKQYFLSESSVLFETLKTMSFPGNKLRLEELSSGQRNHLVQICDNYLELSKEVIERGLKQLPYLNDMLEKKVTFLLNQYQPNAKTFVEEG